MGRIRDEHTDPQLTYLYFPFDRPSKAPAASFAEISAGLDRLPDSTLLFLRHIQEVTWQVEGAPRGFIQKDVVESDVIRVRKRESTNKPTTTHWLKFEAPLKQTPQSVCSIAFMLRRESKKDEDAAAELPASDRSETRPFAVVPLAEPGHLHIFFPAGKEPTGLHFLIHAPFAATVDRASIPFEHEGNTRLIDEIARLLAAALPRLKSRGLLRPGFLSVLPNSKDELERFYSPILNTIIELFQGVELLPTHYAGYAQATYAVVGPREMRTFFTDADLAFS